MSSKGWVAFVGGLPDSWWMGLMVQGGCQDREGTGCGVKGVVKEWMHCCGPAWSMVPGQGIRFPEGNIGWCVVVKHIYKRGEGGFSQISFPAPRKNCRTPMVYCIGKKNTKDFI